jgi:hypothetical protein
LFWPSAKREGKRVERGRGRRLMLLGGINRQKEPPSNWNGMGRIRKMAVEIGGKTKCRREEGSQWPR